MSLLPCVLVIDDDVVVTDTFRRMLQLEGFEVHTATDAADGLKQATTLEPDAILLDLRMPIVDGVGFLRQLRAQERRPPTPVAIVTGDYLLDDAVVASVRTLGATIKFKPLWLEDLVEIARELLAVHSGPSAVGRTLPDADGSSARQAPAAPAL